jgi:hypothetical protein
MAPILTARAREFVTTSAAIRALADSAKVLDRELRSIHEGRQQLPDGPEI